MDTTYYGQPMPETQRACDIADDDKLVSLCNSIFAQLATAAEQEDSRRAIYNIDLMQAYKIMEPMPKPYDWHEAFKHATERSLARLFYELPPSKWRNAVTHLARAIKRDAGLRRDFSEVYGDRSFPF
jgi:hypothetical protein